MLMLMLLFVLRVLFVLIELPAAEYLSKRVKQTPNDGIAGGMDAGVEARENAGRLETAADTESSKRYIVMMRALSGTRHSVAMLVAGIAANVGMVVAESAWFAWDMCVHG